MPNRRDNLMAQFGRRSAREAPAVASINRPKVRAKREFSSPALARARTRQSQKRQLF